MAKAASEVLKELYKKVEKSAELGGDGFNFIVDEIPLRIIRRTLQGKDINGKPLKPLSDTYIIVRKGLLVGEAWFYARSQLTIKNALKHIKGTLSKNKVIVENKLGNAAEIKLIKFKAKNLPEMSSDARPSKSNLTLTGEMLSSIIGTRSANIFTFTFSNPEADKKAYYARNGGRPFFGLSKADEDGLRKKIAGIIRQQMRQLFKS